MVRSARFLVPVALQLCVPAVLYLLVGLYNGRATGLGYLLPNYLFMAAPHLLVAAVALWPQARTSAVLLTLSLLNVLLVVFQLWVLLAVPANESGLAWLFYIPLWGLAVACCATAWIVVRYSGRREAQRRAPDRTIGT